MVCVNAKQGTAIGNWSFLKRWLSMAAVCCACLLNQNSISAQPTNAVSRPHQLVAFSQKSIGNFGQLMSVARSEQGTVFLAAPEDYCVFEFDGREWNAHEFETPPLSVACDSKNRIWVGTDGGAFRGQANQFGLIEFEKIEIPFQDNDNCTLRECAASQDEVVFYNSNLVVRVGEGEPTINRFEQNEYVFHADSDVVVTVDQRRKKLAIRRPGGTTTIDNFTGVGAVPLDDHSFLELDGNNQLWKHQHGKRETFSKGLDSIIKNREIFFVEIIREGHVGIGTTDGFFECTVDGKLVTVAEVADGLLDGFIYRVIADKEGNVWMIDGKGLAVLKPEADRRTIRFAHRSITVNDLESINNNIYLATERGCTILTLNDSSQPNQYVEISELAGKLVSDLHRFGKKLIAVSNFGLFEIEGRNSKHVLQGEFISICQFRGTQEFAVVDCHNRISSVSYIDGGWKINETFQCPFDVFKLHEIEDSSIGVFGFDDQLSLLIWDDEKRKLKIRSKQSADLECMGSALINGRKWFFMSDGNSYHIESSRENALVEIQSRLAAAISQLMDSKNYYTYFKIDEHRYAFCSVNTIDVYSLEQLDNPDHIGGWYLPHPFDIPPRQFSGNPGQLFGAVDRKVYQFDLHDPPPRPNLVSPLVKVFPWGLEKEQKSTIAAFQHKNELKFVFNQPFGQHESDEVQYQYRLLGFHDEWSEWTFEHQKEYMNLPAGEYEFQVRSRIASTVTSNPVSTLFTVSKPWYRSTWFVVLCLVLVSGSGFAIEKIRVNVVRAYQKRLERLMSERLPQIEQQRKQIEAQRDLLEKQSREHEVDKTESLDAIMSAIAHDFNNLLSVIRTYGDVLSMSDDQSVNSQAHKILDATDSASELCEQIKVLSGRLPLNQTKLDLKTLIDESADVIGPTLNNGVSLHRHSLETDSFDSSVLANRSELKQVVMNLLVNANEAARSSIWLTTGNSFLTMHDFAHGRWIGNKPKPGNFHWFEVADDGHGVEETVDAKIFDPFFSTKGIGRGLGLAIVDRIVGRHGGVIFVNDRVEKEGPRGFAFKVCFPQIDSPSQPSATNTLTHKIPESEPMLVLVVDDNEAVLESLNVLLDVLGHQPIGATSGQEALELIEDHEPDIVFIDLMMPGMKGDEVARRIRRVRPEIPIVLMSGYSESQIDEVMLRESEITFIAKPIGINVLKKSLELLDATSSKA